MFRDYGNKNIELKQVCCLNLFSSSQTIYLYFLTEKDNLEDSDLCKICMDNPVDCVMLECGHMCTCTTCGKQMVFILLNLLCQKILNNYVLIYITVITFKYGHCIYFSY